MPSPAKPAPLPPTARQVLKQPVLEPAPQPLTPPAPKPAPKPVAKPEPDARREPVLEGEIVSQSPVPSPGSSPAAHTEPEMFEEKEGFGAQLDELLAELHLSRKHIIYGIGCFALLILLIFGAIFGYRFYKNRQPEQTQPAPATEQPQPKQQEAPAAAKSEETAIQISSDVGKVVIMSPEAVGETGIAAAVVIGMQAEGHTPTAYYILTFRRLQNAYATNIDELLNKSTDRRARLHSHLALLRKLNEDGSVILQRIKNEIVVIQAEYEPQKKKQEVADVNFFEQLNALNPETTQNILSDFIDASREVSALRARFKALQKIQELYEKGLPKLANRIHDIELNEEALVAGIKVYDIKGSSLDLIVPVAGKPQAQDSFDSGPAIPLIPVRPSQINVGKDFITKPGGGF